MVFPATKFIYLPQDAGLNNIFMGFGARAHLCPGLTSVVVSGR